MAETIEGNFYRRQVKAMWKMPIGIDDFEKIRTKDFYFVDKTDFIRQLIDSSREVTLITRPRRFGKTLTMSMLECFFSIEKETQSRHLFDGLSIERAGAAYMAQRGQYPVLFLSLKDFSCRSWPDMLEMWAEYLQSCFLQHTQLRNQEKVQPELIENFQDIVTKKANKAALANALALLVRMMRQYYGRKVIVLIDEYDAPIQQAWECGFYDKMIAFMRQFLGSVLKGNDNLDFAVLTGVLHVAKESIFSGLNNLKVCSVLDENYADVFGFTAADVARMAVDLQHEGELPEIQDWYDGYRFGGQKIYNPWSVINFFDQGRSGDYWINTSGNSILHQLLSSRSPQQEKDLYALLKGQSVSAVIRESLVYEDLKKYKDALCSMLVTTGYLTVIEKKQMPGGPYCRLQIPNKEIRDAYQFEVLQHMSDTLAVSDLYAMLEALLGGDAEIFSDDLQRYLAQFVSAYDAANKESFYHGLLLGLTALVLNDYTVESNRESGYGRFDLAIFPKETDRAGVIMEFKVAANEGEMEEKAKEALQQIEDREYVTEFQKRGVKEVWKYGIAFCGKKIVVHRSS